MSSSNLFNLLVDGSVSYSSFQLGSLAPGCLQPVGKTRKICNDGFVPDSMCVAAESFYKHTQRKRRQTIIKERRGIASRDRWVFVNDKHLHDWSTSSVQTISRIEAELKSQHRSADLLEFKRQVCRSLYLKDPCMVTLCEHHLFGVLSRWRTLLLYSIEQPVHRCARYQIEYVPTGIRFNVVADSMHPRDIMFLGTSTWRIIGLFNPMLPCGQMFKVDAGSIARNIDLSHVNAAADSVETAAQKMSCLIDSVKGLLSNLFLASDIVACVLRCVWPLVQCFVLGFEFGKCWPSLINLFVSLFPAMEMSLLTSCYEYAQRAFCVFKNFFFGIPEGQTVCLKCKLAHIDCKCGSRTDISLTAVDLTAVGAMFSMFFACVYQKSFSFDNLLNITSNVVSRVHRVASEGPKAYHDIKNICDDTHAAIYYAATGEIMPSERQVVKRRLQIWRSECEALCAHDTSSMINVNPDVRERIDNLYKETLELETIFKSSADKSLYREFSCHAVAAKDLYRALVESGANLLKTRPQPSCVLFAGKTAVGKSTMVKQFIFACIMYWNSIVEEEERVNPDNLEALVYFYTSGSTDNFMTCYRGQMFCVFDDLLQTKDTLARPNPDVDLIFRCINNVGYSTPQAAVNSKGNAPFTSPFVIVTANCLKFDVPSCQSNEAFNRRFEIKCEFLVRPECADTTYGAPRLDQVKAMHNKHMCPNRFLRHYMDDNMESFRQEEWQFGDIVREYVDKFLAYRNLSRRKLDPENFPWIFRELECIRHTLRWRIDHEPEAVLQENGHPDWVIREATQKAQTLRALMPHGKGWFDWVYKKEVVVNQIEGKETEMSQRLNNDTLIILPELKLFHPEYIMYEDFVRLQMMWPLWVENLFAMKEAVAQFPEAFPHVKVENLPFLPGDEEGAFIYTNNKWDTDSSWRLYRYLHKYLPLCRRICEESNGLEKNPLSVLYDENERMRYKNCQLLKPRTYVTEIRSGILGKLMDAWCVRDFEPVRQFFTIGKTLSMILGIVLSYYTLKGLWKVGKWLASDSPEGQSFIEVKQDHVPQVQVKSQSITEVKQEVVPKVTVVSQSVTPVKQENTPSVTIVSQSVQEVKHEVVPQVQIVSQSFTEMKHENVPQVAVKSQLAIFDVNVPIDKALNMPNGQSADKMADQLRKKIIANLVTIECKYGDQDVPIVRGLFVKGNVVMTVRHCDFALRSADHINLRRLLSVNWSGCRWSDIKVHYLSEKQDEMAYDVMLLEMPFGCPYGHNLLKRKNGVAQHWISDEDLSSFTYTPAMLCGLFYRNDVPIHREIPVNLKCNDYRGRFQRDYVPHFEEWYIRRGCEYTAMTEDGDCGSVIIAINSSLRRKILGIHNAGLGNVGYGMIVTIEKIEKALSAIPQGECKTLDWSPDKRIKDFPSITYEGGRDSRGNMCLFASLNEPLGPNFFHMGELEQAPGDVGKSKLKKSPIADQVQSDPSGWKSKKRPAILRPRTYIGSDGQQFHVDPLVKGLQKCAGPDMPIDRRKVDECLAHIFHRFLDDYDGKKSTRQRVYTIEEAIKGDVSDPRFASLNRKSSTGWYPQRDPWIIRKNKPRGFKGKQYFLGANQDYLILPEVFEDCARIVRKIRKGKRPTVFFVDTLKDELRPNEKTDPLAPEKISTRVFSASPMDFSIVFRQYFGGFIAHVAAGHIDNGIGVGMDVHSEWLKLTERLRSKGPHVVAGDYSNYDGSLLASIISMVVDKINAWYNDGPENAMIRRALWLEVFNGVHVCRGHLYAWGHSQPSGNPMTAVLNSILNLVFCMLAWMDVMKGTPIPPTLRSYDEHVADIVYGDDNNLNVSDVALQYYNQDTITKSMAKIGLTYTSEDKTISEVPYKKLSESTFLKRHFVSGDQVDVCGRLSLDTILEMVLWVRDGVDAERNFRQTLFFSLMELSYWGEEVYNRFLPAYQRACDKAQLRIGRLPSYYSQVVERVHRDDLRGGKPACADWMGNVLIPSVWAEG